MGSQSTLPNSYWTELSSEERGILLSRWVGIDRIFLILFFSSGYYIHSYVVTTRICLAGPDTLCKYQYLRSLSFLLILAPMLEQLDSLSYSSSTDYESTNFVCSPQATLFILTVQHKPLDKHAGV